jgi:glycosyltransferase involved in cell wall biosynthesis
MVNSTYGLSVVIITFNEERNIGDCLASVKDLADEIIVVDSFSTDGTKSICSSYNVRWVENPFPGHIEQKNLAASLASFSHVLSLDADERVSNELAASILREKKAGFPSVGYTMNRFNNYCGQWIRHGGWYPEKKLRLWKKDAGKWQGDNPHDKFELFEGKKPSHLKGDLLHYSFRSFSEHVNQMNKFSSIAAKTLFDKGRQPSVLKPLLSGFWAFFNGYVIHMGFLDGFYGYVIARNNGMYSFYKYAKLNELHKGKIV